MPAAVNNPDELAFRFVSGPRALDLVSTLGDRHRQPVERLREAADLDRWLAAVHLVGMAKGLTQATSRTGVESSRSCVAPGHRRPELRQALRGCATRARVYQLVVVTSRRYSSPGALHLDPDGSPRLPRRSEEPEPDSIHR